jgi:hypothetical protein
MLSQLRDSRVLSYAVVVSALLLVAGGGWAIAASSGGVITACAAKSGGALRIATGCKASERPVSWNKVGPRGPTGLRGARGLRGLPGAPATALWFAVNADGTVVASSGLASTTNVRTDPGLYLITFNRDIRGVCAPVVSLGSNDSTGGFAGEIATNFVVSPASQLRVRTFDSAGSASDSAFHGAVFC